MRASAVSGACAFRGENSGLPLPTGAALNLQNSVNQVPLKSSDTSALDRLTGGAFSAPTSGERTARVREWLTSQPEPEQLQEVYRELSGRDKGAAKLLREKLDEIKRSRNQETVGAEWAEKASGLLAQPKLNIADAMAWQRDAAKAGAPLSREPLASLKTQLADRVRGIEDLQHRVQVQREAAVLLAQRIEVLSTKPWRDAQAAAESLVNDIPAWQAQAQALAADANWASVDARFPPLLEASQAQLQVVWDAFQAALAQAAAAASDAAAPLPPVPVWADELRVARGIPVEAAPKPQRPKVDPEARARAAQVVEEVLKRLEQEIAQGHGKGASGAAAALRNALKEHGRLVDEKLESRAHAALTAAGELEGWQRWSADQQRQELVSRAEALFERPPAAEGQEAPAPKPRYGGRKMQENLRTLREQWKRTDQAGPPNHALWKRFDEACNEAYKVVEAWLEKVKSEAAEHKAHRLALIEEVKAWALENATARDGDWKGFARILQQFENRWREAGHLSEKAFAEMQPLWKETMQHAAAPLVAVQKQSLEHRHAMIDEARELGAQPQLRVDAVKALQQRWQFEAQSVPLDRKHEQKLWDAFRKPIDEAFNRKGEEREKAAAHLSERDRIVLDASQALQAANASGDAQKIRAAMAALDAALRGQAQAAAAVAKADQAAQQEKSADAADTGASAQDATERPAQDNEGVSESEADAQSPAEATVDAEGAPAQGASAAPTAPPKPGPKPVIARRGDDRPGMKKAVPEPAGRGGKFGDRKGGGGMFGDRTGGPRGDSRGGAGRYGAREQEDRGPRLGDAAFRAQRDALEHAQSTLRKLAAQAHGEALTQLMAAWEQRSADQVPSLSELGKAVSAAVRSSWVQAIGAEPAGDASEALLRLEMATELPTPAEHINARRALQLQLLTRRNDPSPAQTWGQDAARVLATRFEAQAARRLQNVLKLLLRG
jgi:ATP-dependent RNA helicase SUPV3L1/SUV3